jgi:N-sulfoglucosamine sulfohydrolase
MYGLAHAEHNFDSFPRVKGVPALLKGRGYRSGVIAKLHVQPASVYPFDRVIAGPAGGRDVAGLAQRAREFIAESKEQPFLLVVGFTDPHRAGKGYANDRDYPGVRPIVYAADSVRVPHFLPDLPAVRADLADYCQSVSRLDQGVGLMMQVLKETGRDKDTLVIYLSDNGIPFPGAKTTLYDPGVHLPLIVRSPTQRKGGLVNRALVSWVDIVPTMLDWAGAKTQEELPGRSLLPILEEENAEGWDKVYLSHTFHEVTMYYPMRGIRTRQYKYIWNLAHELPFPPASDLYASPTYQALLEHGDGMGARSFKAYRQRPKEELYDMSDAPAEIKNLAGDPAFAKVLDDMRRDLHSFQQRTKDPWVVRRKY